MTIVLQHQYENLSVEEDRFFVTLRFNGQAVNLDIPFEEITGFTDPSVNFGLQLKTTDMDEDDMEEYDYPFEPPAEEQDQTRATATVKTIPLSDSVDNIAKGDTADTTGKAVDGDGNGVDDAGTPQTGEVIALDAFRKK